MYNAGKAALPILWKFFERWPDALTTMHADWKEIAALVHPLGFYEKRAKIIIRFSGLFYNKILIRANHLIFVWGEINDLIFVRMGKDIGHANTIFINSISNIKNIAS